MILRLQCPCDRTEFEGVHHLKMSVFYLTKHFDDVPNKYGYDFLNVAKMICMT